MINFSKKAQLGIFIIVGTILVISFIMVVSLNKDKIEIFSDDKSSVSVRTFVDSCLETTTQRSMEIVAARGGWIYPPSSIIKYAKTDSTDLLSKDAQGVDFFGEETPYWYYYDDSSEKFKFSIPPYDDDEVDFSIINQMERFVKENIENECLQDLIVFEDAYEIDYNPSDIEVEIEFTDNKVFAYLLLPIEITELNTQAYEYIESFTYETQNKIRLPYLLAKDVVKSESRSSFLEHRVLDFIYPNQQTDNRENLPPFYDFDLTYDFEPWRVDVVENRLKEILDSNVHLIQDLNTKYKENEVPQGLEDNAFANAVLNGLYTKDYLSENSQLLEDGEERIFENDFKDMTLNFDYDVFYPMHFRINPSIGNTIVMPNPQSFLGLVPLFMTEYVSTYEITTPIFVEIVHEDYPSFNFRFPIEINIDYNTPLRENYDFEIDDDLINGDNSRLSQQLTCNPSQFISKPVKINISDPIANGLRTHPSDPKIGVEGAIVQFTCKNFQTCPIITSTPINGVSVMENITQLEFNLPIDCSPGKLEIIKYGHKTITLDVNPNLEEERILGEVKMYSSKTLQLEVKKKDPLLLVGNGNPLSNNEVGFLIFENLDEENFVSVVEIDGSSIEEINIDLMPGRYSVKGFIIDELGSTIPKEVKSFSTGIFSSDEKVTLPQINLSTWVSAGLEIDELEIDEFDIMTSDKVTVYFVEYGTPKNYDDLEEMSSDMGEMKEISQRADFEPDFN